MTDEITNIKEWRAKEIAKLFLLKSDYKVSFIERGLFDLMVLVGDNPAVELGLFVLLSNASDSDLKEQIEYIQTKKTVSYDVPIMLMLIDEVKESGEVSFLVEPNGPQLVTLPALRFLPLNSQRLSNCLKKVVSWGNSQNQKIA